MNTLPSWKKLRNPDPKTITSPVGVPRRPGFRALDSTCMKFSMFIQKVLDFLFADSNMSHRDLEKNSPTSKVL